MAHCKMFISAEITQSKTFPGQADSLGRHDAHSLREGFARSVHL